ncbi:MAG TPA: ABC transporter ATP-binding protein, partial [Anaerolineae bacterium]|nr:ABC transporter ATP-binding protein [Anaerolineae bacterium]
FQLNPGDRIGIIGPNGAGKSTFLDVLAGKTEPDSGSVQWGETVHLGYYDQQSLGLREEMRVIDYINDTAPLIRTQDGQRVEAAQMLEWFLFTRPEQQAKIGSLSGGERRRLYLLRTLIHQPNVLFLDEPTNDLDVQTLTVLEQFLDYFQGCLVVVSHDRYFLDRNVDFLMSFESGVLGTRYPTPYETYRRLREEAAAPPPPVKKKPVKEKRPSPPQAKLTWKQKRELEELESRISNLEKQKAILEEAINQTGRDYKKLQSLAEELTAVKEELETAEMRWLELAEIA